MNTIRRGDNNYPMLFYDNRKHWEEFFWIEPCGSAPEGSDNRLFGYMPFNFSEKPPVAIDCYSETLAMLVAAGQTEKTIAAMTRLANLDKRYARCSAR